MELLLLNYDFQSIESIDTFESLIWTERYSSPGDFELYTIVSLNFIKLLKLGYYLHLKGSKYVMIIESISIETDAEKGNHLKVTGRSLESLLDRRIIWNQTIISSKIQTGILKLLNDNIITPSDDNRKIENFIFKEIDDPRIAEVTIRKQYTGDNLLEAVQEICSLAKIGFRIILTDQNQFVFELYSGDDRSFNQIINPYVVFSPSYENLLNSRYYESESNLKNVALIAGEDEGNERKTISIGDSSGLYRRELYVDARDIQSETSSGKLTDNEYNALLLERGTEKLSEYKHEKAFDGEVEETGQTYVYNKDYFMGDIVQIINEYGMESTSRVTELIKCQNESGYTVIPTFISI